MPIRAGFLGEKGHVQSEAGPTTVRMFRRVEQRILDLDALVNQIRNDALTRIRATASISVRKDSASVDVGTEPRLNFVAGNGITQAVTDVPADFEVKITTAVNPGFGLEFSGSAVVVDQDMVPTWTGVHTFSAQDVHNAGVSLGTSGVVDSKVVDAAGAVQYALDPTTNLTDGFDRFLFRLGKDAVTAGASTLQVTASGNFVFGATTGNVGTPIAVLQLTSSLPDSTFAGSASFAPSAISSAGVSIAGQTSSIFGGAFATRASTSASATRVFGGMFYTTNLTSTTAYSDFWGVFIRTLGAHGGGAGTTSTRGGGILIKQSIGTSLPTYTHTFTNWDGILIENACTLSKPVFTSVAGIRVLDQTRAVGTNFNGILIETPAGTTAYKALAIRDQTSYIASFVAGQLNYMGGFAIQTVTKTANYTATATDHVILCNATTGSFTITLPAVANTTGRIYRIKKIDGTANTVTIDANASETIDDATTQVLTAAYTSVDIVSDGTEWWIV